jgi:hypothetical protein
MESCPEAAGGSLSTRLPLALLLGALLTGCAGLPDTTDTLWPARQEEVLPGDDGVRTWFWPMVQERTVGTTVTTVIGPIARVVDDERGRTIHALHPIFTHRTRPRLRQTAVRPLFYSGTRVFTDGRVNSDWMFLFLLYGGSDSEAGDYFLFFPFWGNTRNSLGKDEMRFRLFPLYVDTRKDGYRSRFVFWPLFGSGEGDGKRFVRALPFLVVDRWEGRRYYTSILWPFLHWSADHLNTKYPVHTFFAFPFYGRRDSEISWSRAYLWPFFTFSGGRDGFLNVHAPWPIFRYAEGPDDLSALKILPFMFHYRHGEERVDSILWPIIWRTTYILPMGRMENVRFLPFMRKTRVLDMDGNIVSGTDQLWPLFRNVRREDGTVRFQAPDLIPFRGWLGIRESYDWIWTLVDHRRDLDGRSSTNILWGLIQHRSGPGREYAGVPILLEYARDGEDAKFHILRGLAGYEESEEGSAIRLFWFVRLPL